MIPARRGRKAFALRSRVDGDGGGGGDGAVVNVAPRCLAPSWLAGDVPASIRAKGGRFHIDFQRRPSSGTATTTPTLLLRSLKNVNSALRGRLIC